MVFRSPTLLRGTWIDEKQMGTPDNPGLIPRTCEDLFDRIELEGNPNCTYNVRVSYFEVYNEHVRDLLAPRKEPPNNLKIRESPTEGPYVKDLTETTVKSLVEVLNLMKMGDAVCVRTSSLLQKSHVFRAEQLRPPK